MLDETAENMQRNFGSGYPGGKTDVILSHAVPIVLIKNCMYNKSGCVLICVDPQTKSWLEDHKHHIFGFPSLV